jgi:DNA-binding SARP family transcriptional activator
MVTRSQSLQPPRTIQIIEHDAIDHALAGRWEEAVKANLEGTAIDVTDIGCHNRLAKAYLELSRYKDARASLEKTLEIDPGNKVANRQLERLSQLGNGGVVRRTLGGAPTNSDLFISDPSCSTVSKLKKIAQPEQLATISAGDRLKLQIGDAIVTVQTVNGDYVGTMEVRIGARLRKMVAIGKQYEILAVKSSDSEVLVMVREIKRQLRQDVIASFPLYLQKTVADFDLDDLMTINDQVRIEENLDEETPQPVEAELMKSIILGEFGESDQDARL